MTIKSVLYLSEDLIPLWNNKFIPFKHPAFEQTADGKGKPYIHTPKEDSTFVGHPFEILNKQSLAYFEKLKEKGENVYIDEMTLEQFMLLGNNGIEKRLKKAQSNEKKSSAEKEMAYELEYQDDDTSGGEKNTVKKKSIKDDTVTNRILNWSFSKEQKEEAKAAMKGREFLLKGFLNTFILRHQWKK